MRCGAVLEGWYCPGEHAPAVLLMHGLGGSPRSGYVRRAAARASAEGHAVLALAHRGSGPETERTTRPYMTGNTADVEDALEWLRERASTRRIMAVGYSISGNTLLLTLGTSEVEPPELSLAVAPPIDLDRASSDLLEFRARAYDLWVLRACRMWIPRLRGDSPGPHRVPALSGLRTFDEQYIVPVWRFRDLDDYYTRASAQHVFDRIRSPVVVLHADDDPVVRVDALRRAKRNPFVDVQITSGGGHLGFLARAEGRHRPRRWLPEALAHYLSLCRNGALAGARSAPPHPAPEPQS